jgi:hypothetical protein
MLDCGPNPTTGRCWRSASPAPPAARNWLPGGWNMVDWGHILTVSGWRLKPPSLRSPQWDYSQRARRTAAKWQSHKSTFSNGCSGWG